MRQYPAIALIEFSSIPAGIKTGDIMLKQAPVAVLRSGTVHNGKYLFMVGGTPASVAVAYDVGRSAGEDHVIDHMILPDVHQQVHDAIMGHRIPCSFEAVGIVETSTVAAAISGTDAAIKDTAVDLVELRLADDLGGKSLIILTGHIESIERAVEVLRLKATSHGAYLHDSVIPNLDADLRTQLEQSTRFCTADLIRINTGEE